MINKKYIGLVYVLVAICIAGPENSSNDTEMPKNGSSWPVGVDFVHLGREGTPDFFQANAPTEMVKAASSILIGKPETWRVCYEKRGALSGVVFINDKSGSSFICLARVDRWIRLNEPAGVPCLSKFLENRISSLDELRDPIKVEKYISDIARLYKGDRRLLLTSSFLKLVGSDWEVWLGGTEKKISALRGFCGNPKMILNGDRFEIECNIINPAGGIEKWVVKGVFKQSPEIREIKVIQIRKNGAYSYGLVG